MMEVRRPCKMLLCLWLVLVEFEGLGCLGCLEEERIGLLNLKAAFTESPLPFHFLTTDLLPSWDSAKQSDCCLWKRIECNNDTTRRVIRISLDNTRGFESLLFAEAMKRYFYLNASLFLPFEQLRVLDLTFNYISGWFDSNEGFSKLSRLNKLEVLKLRYNFFKSLTSLGKLTSLKTLYLGTNALSGAIPIQEFASLRKLEVLDLTDNSFDGSIPSSIWTLTSLKALYLGGNKLNGSLPNQGFKSLSKLEVLELSSNRLSGSIPSSIGTLSFLRALSLRSNGLNGSLPIQGLCNLKNLEELDLSRNGFEKNLPACLSNLTSLRLLDLSENKLEGNIPSSLFPSLTLLEYLSLSYNQFEGLVQFSLFSNNSKLEVFELISQNNQLVVETEYPPWVPRFQLKALALSNCNLNKPSGAIPSFLSSQYNLRRVDLSHNNLKGKLPMWILENNTRLQFLSFMNNSFIGPFHLPSNSNHTHMAFFDISINQIHTELPSNIGAILPNLKVLNMSKSSLQGNIPKSLGDIRSLLSLDLSKNNFSGKVLDWIGNFSNLISLDISRNRFEGPIPIIFCKFSELRFLDLSQNNLNGTIPSCLKLSSLKYLHLQKNVFTGPIPNALAQSSSLVTLDMSDNNLFGYIPNWIDAFSELRVLLLKGNQLQGSIPIQLCQLDKLSLMDLSHNNLSGTIPSCLNNISFGRAGVMDDAFDPSEYISTKSSSSVEYKILLNFNLGDIPSYKTSHEQEDVVFTTKKRSESYKGMILYLMSGMDLSSNKLNGHVPPEIGHLSGIHSLNLSHNCLTGPIPETFSNLKQVESLDLSYNRLSGTIPPQLTGLTFLSIFTVAHNNLSGKTPDMKNQFGTFSDTSYEGNSLLCGPPLQKSCTIIETPPLIPRPSNAREDNTSNLTSFRVSFAISYIIGLLGYIALLYFNSHWRGIWFSYIDACIAFFHRRIVYRSS